MNALVIAFLIAVLPFIMEANEVNINSVKPVAEFINAQPGNNKSVVTYDYLLPSLSFYTDIPVTTLQKDNNAAIRELNFTKTTEQAAYKYYSLHDSSFSIADAGTVIRGNPYLLVNYRFAMPDSIKQQLTFSKKQPFEKKWQLYY